jgi:hypothetical protein
MKPIRNLDISVGGEVAAAGVGCPDDCKGGAGVAKWSRQRVASSLMSSRRGRSVEDYKRALSLAKRASSRCGRSSPVGIKTEREGWQRKQAKSATGNL